MTVFLALLIFMGIAALVWAVALAVFQTYLGGPDLRKAPHFYFLSAVPILLIGMASFAPFWISYGITLFLWWLTASNMCMLPTPMALRLFATLAVLSFVARILMLGILAL